MAMIPRLAALRISARLQTPSPRHFHKVLRVGFQPRSTEEPKALLPVPNTAAVLASGVLSPTRFPERHGLTQMTLATPSERTPWPFGWLGRFRPPKRLRRQFRFGPSRRRHRAPEAFAQR